LDGQRLAVATASGEVRITLMEPLTVIGVAAAHLADITPGSYVGTAARPQSDGTLRALEVHIFPETLRGTGEGHRPMDPPDRTMTNATVQDVVRKVTGSLLTLKYKDGEVTVVVPPDAPVVRFVPGDRALLTPGAGVVIFRAVQAEDGSITASRINVGVGGIMPPM